MRPLAKNPPRAREEGSTRPMSARPAPSPRARGGAWFHKRDDGRARGGGRRAISPSRNPPRAREEGATA